MKSDKRPIKVALVGLSSPSYPALGETHGIYVLGGDLRRHFKHRVDIKIIDMCTNLTFSCEKVVEKLLSMQPDIVGFSILQGTLGNLREILDNFREKQGNRRSLVVFGNCVATYAHEELLQRYPFAVIAIGEGELSLRGLVKFLLYTKELCEVPNVLFARNGKIMHTKRMLVDIKSIGMPIRISPRKLARKGVQIFVEGSRGCHWAQCTFCSRGLFGKRRGQWRSFEAERVVSQIESLSRKGVWEITFSDEDFIGPPEVGLNRAQEIAMEIVKRGISMNFRISCNVNSIFSFDDDDHAIKTKQRTFKMLKEAGLNKVYLGVESGANTQLKRYQKGFVAGEASRAITLLRQLGIELEVGFIMFDPLMVPFELSENISFIEKEKVLSDMPEVLREMRAQPGSLMIKILRMESQKTGFPLIGEKLDLNTLTYPIRYMNPVISNITTLSKTWTRTMHSLRYILKADTRFAESLENRERKMYLRSYLDQLKTLDLLLLKELKRAFCGQVMSKHMLLDILMKLERSRIDIIKEMLSGVLENEWLDPHKRVKLAARNFLRKSRLTRTYSHLLEEMFD